MRISCHVFRNSTATGFVLAQAATAETLASEQFKNIPVIALEIPETGLQEITDFYDDIMTASGFVKSGLMTENEAEAAACQYGDTDGLRFIAEGRASAYFVEPYQRDSCGYSNPSRLYLLPALPFVAIPDIG